MSFKGDKKSLLLNPLPLKLDTEFGRTMTSLGMTIHFRLWILKNSQIEFQFSDFSKKKIFRPNSNFEEPLRLCSSDAQMLKFWINLLSNRGSRGRKNH